MEAKTPFKSKTIVACVLIMILGLFVLFCGVESPPIESWDAMGEARRNVRSFIIGVSILVLGALAIKGRYDADTKIDKLHLRKRKENNEN